MRIGGYPAPLLGGDKLSARSRGKEPGRCRSGCRFGPLAFRMRRKRFHIRSCSILIILGQDRRPGEGSSDPIWSEEQVTQCATQKISDPPLRQMAGPVVDQVASLTKTAQVTQPVVDRIMIKVRSGKHDTCRSQPHHLFQVGPTSDAPASVAPCSPCLIVPSPVRQAAHSGAMRPAAPLAHAAGTLEAHAPAELTPMSRI